MTIDSMPGTGAPDDPPASYEDRVLGCLLGTLAGDAFGVLTEDGAGTAGVPEEPTASSISAATHLTLSTVDGIVEALEWANDGVAADETACLWLAYLRWSVRQGAQLPPEAPAPPARWLDRQEGLPPGLRAAAASLPALATGAMGSRARPLNPSAEGPGALMRSAPFGLVPRIPGGMVERLTVEAAALTHGSSAAQDAAARFSGIIRRLVVEGAAFDDGLADAATRGAAFDHPTAAGGGGPESVGAPRPTASATLDAAVHAVRAGATASRSPQEQRAAVLAAAVEAPVRGSSPVVAASLAGGIIGALHGTAALPPSYLTAPGVPAVVRAMGRTLLSATTGA
ncbi:hypothetical protein AC792_00945 [Arthrobacter sp. RIT-PI-e]|uniref:ADP-ribosylglycohydrolase family protein n=1 Tax=Arthrobacter sp. RIT-PI-e TaxID=1681197 RepID=UPI000676161C|nr:ADP-ribosylglycohydrolase family protein [Arthrobacter sp. RIT-PI-e]KNC20391.1 hypothetical protein AC792_00945 [Arthrobacter sp. RIT-PI-e]